MAFRRFSKSTLGICLLALFATAPGVTAARVVSDRDSAGQDSGGQDSGGQGSVGQDPVVPANDSNLSDARVRNDYMELADRAVAPLAARIRAAATGTERQQASALLREIVMTHRFAESLERLIVTALAAEHQRAGDDVLRADSLLLMGELYTAKVLQYLRPRLGHPDFALSAIQALGLSPNPDATEVLIRGLSRDTLGLQHEYLHALARRRDPDAAPTVLRFLRAKNPRVRMAALVALGQIPAEGALEGLLSVTCDSNDSMSPAAFRSFVVCGQYLVQYGMAKAANRVYAKAIQNDKASSSVRAAVWDALGASGQRTQFEWIGRDFEAAPENERRKMVSAAFEMIDRLGRTGLGDSIPSVLSKILPTLPKGSEERRRAADVLRAVERGQDPKKGTPVADGWIRDWWVCGAFSARGVASWSRILPPEHGVHLLRPVDVENQAAHWSHHRTEHPRAHVDLASLVSPREHAVAYAYVEVFVSEPAAAVLSIGSDDGLVVWSDGVEVERSDAPRSFTPGSDRVPLLLKRGWNPILLKVPQVDQAWLFSARLLDPTGAPLSCRVR